MFSYSGEKRWTAQQLIGLELRGEIVAILEIGVQTRLRPPIGCYYLQPLKARNNVQLF